MNALQVALARRDALREELGRVERFIKAYHDFTGMALPKSNRRRFTVRPREVCRDILTVLEAAPRPMTRSRIVEALRGIGRELESPDPALYVGILIWRYLRDNVEHTPYGYAIRSSIAQKRSLSEQPSVNETHPTGTENAGNLRNS